MARPALLALVVVAAGGVTPSAAAQELTYSGSLQFATGSYIFTEPTRTLSLYNGLGWTGSRARLSASLPLILQNSGAVNVVGGGYLPTGGTDSEAVGGRKQGSHVPMGAGGPRYSEVLAAANPAAAADSALPADSVVEGPGDYAFSVGDPFVAGGVELFQGFGALRSLEVTASVKAPLNDLESGVGTGAWDYSIGAAAAMAVGRVLTFLDLSYWWYGDLPGLELQDGLSWGGGLGLPLSRRVWVSAMATRANRIIATAEAAQSVSGGISYRREELGTLSLSAGAGLSEASPSFSISFGWRRSLFGGS